MKLDELIFDMAPFADLGEDAPSAKFDEGKAVIKLTRHGEVTRLILSSDELIEQVGNETRRYRTLGALLASPNYADLPLWADRQRSLLGKAVSAETLPLRGDYDGGIDVDAAKTIDDLLVVGRTEQRRNTVVVLNGPAGIGKTSIIRKLTNDRAVAYRAYQRPLILHVESRGRVLQNISDLMAFSLQSLRINVTFDQVPTLVKHGLITLAIDGFDELGDPNGYDLAWAQLNDLILSTRGLGSFILSGRETFIEGARIKGALPAIDEKLDSINTFNVTAVEPTVAQRWLLENGWKDEALSSVNAEPLFERGSYALRPFFLSQLASAEISEEILRGSIDDTLEFLINLMLEREQRKFGRDVEVAITRDQRVKFIRDLMEEVARDLAENQTDAISTEILAWLSDAVSEDLPKGVQGILRNRADVIAFLTNDERRGYRRFVHEEVESYFLASTLMKSVISGEVPKYIRRNIFGSDFLENFAETIRYRSDEIIQAFIKSACNMIAELTDSDRSKRNLASLVLAACSVAETKSRSVISDVSMEEAFVTQTVAPIQLERVTIGQLDARRADLRQVFFVECNIVTLVADEGTVPSQTIPTPSVLALPSGTLVQKDEIERWFGERYWEKIGAYPEFSFSKAVEEYQIFRLLARLARYRPFWLKDCDEKAARRILDDSEWPALREILLSHGFLLVRDDVPAAGRPSTFYHLRNRDALLNLDLSSSDMRQMLRELFAAAIK